MNDEYLKLKKIQEELRSQLSENSYFRQLGSDIQEKLRSGTAIYLHGLRSAAHVAGWNKDHFDAVYGYLSAQPHSAPMSFYRMDERGMDNKTVAPCQFAFIGFALEHAYQSIEHATDRIQKLFPK